jgi:DUF3014 family protein
MRPWHTTRTRQCAIQYALLQEHRYRGGRFPGNVYLYNSILRDSRGSKDRSPSVKTTTAIAFGALVAAAGLGVWWGQRLNVVRSPDSGAATASVAPSAAVPAAASATGIQHPVPVLEAPDDTASHDFESDFAGLLKHGAIAVILRPDDFDRRFVATVDNLGRSSAPAGAWPVEPAGGRFQVAAAGDGDAIGQQNDLRYLPYVLALDQVDLHEAIRMYAWHYPALQHQYEELGFPGRYFNDRFVQVLDQLLATPDVPPPLRVHLPRAAGAQPTRPWVLYEFDDPALRSLSAGQRILLRMGPANERRVKHRLAELRRLLASSPADQESVEPSREREEHGTPAAAASSQATR